MEAPIETSDEVALMLKETMEAARSGFQKVHVSVYYLDVLYNNSLKLTPFQLEGHLVNPIGLIHLPPHRFDPVPHEGIRFENP